MGMAYPVAKGEDAWTTLDSLSGVAGTNSFPAGRKVACASPPCRLRQHLDAGFLPKERPGFTLHVIHDK